MNAKNLLLLYLLAAIVAGIVAWDILRKFAPEEKTCVAIPKPVATKREAVRKVKKIKALPSSFRQKRKQALKKEKKEFSCTLASAELSEMQKGQLNELNKERLLHVDDEELPLPKDIEQMKKHNAISW